MLEKTYSQRYAWIYLSISFIGGFYLLDEMFVYVLENYVESNRMVFHRLVLFAIVSAFIIWSQYALSTLVKLNRSLIQSARLATLGEMSAMMAHELVSPMTVLKLESELNQMESGNEALRTFSKSVCRQIDRCTTIVDSLRDFGKGHANLERERHDLNDILFGAVEFTNPFMEQLEVKCELASGLSPIYASANQIEQIFSNLLVNAKDAIEEFGSGSIQVQTVESEGYVEAAVSNTGKTVPEHILSKLFEPFFTTKNSDKGTGLGLAICRKIATDHGGSLRVVSRNGVTCFTLRLPVASSAELQAHNDS